MPSKCMRILISMAEMMLMMESELNIILNLSQHDAKSSRLCQCITKYIDELDDLVSCQKKGLLRSFSRQLCLSETKNMKDTVLTIYFLKFFTIFQVPDFLESIFRKYVWTHNPS